MMPDRLAVEDFADRLWAHLNKPAPIVWIIGAYGGGENWTKEVLRARSILTEQIYAAETLLNDLDAMIEQPMENDQ